MSDTPAPSRRHRRARTWTVATAIACAGAVWLPSAFSAPTISGQAAEVRQLESEVLGLEARYAQADSAYRQAQDKVKELNDRITKNTKSLAAAKKRHAQAQGTLGERLSMIYRQDPPTRVQLLLQSRSISAAISSVDNLERVRQADSRLIVRLREARAAMITARRELIVDRKEANKHRAVVKKSLAEVAEVRIRRRAVLISARAQLAQMIAYEVEQQNAARAAALRRARAQIDDQLQGGSSGAAPTPVVSPSPSSGGNIDAKLRQIALCESGGNPTAVSPSGLYRGKYQFDPQTWSSLGGSGLPDEASEAEQDRIAGLLYQQRGAAPWPVCGR